MPAMCGRFAQPRSSDELARLYEAAAVGRLPGEQYNVAPTDEVSSVLQPHEERLVDTFRWGLVPVWAASAREGARMQEVLGCEPERMPPPDGRREHDGWER